MKQYEVTYIVWDNRHKRFQVDGGVLAVETADGRKVRKLAREQIAFSHRRRNVIEITSVTASN